MWDPVFVGAGLARDGYLPIFVGGLNGGHIRYFGNGFYWFRPYGGSLLIERKSKQNALAPPLGTSLWLGVPSLRLWSVGRRDGPSLAQRG